MFSTKAKNTTHFEGKLLKVFSSPTKKDLRSQLRLCLKHCHLATENRNKVTNEVRDWVFEQSEQKNIVDKESIVLFLKMRGLTMAEFDKEEMFEKIVYRVNLFSKVLVLGLSMHRSHHPGSTNVWQRGFSRTDKDIIQKSASSLKPPPINTKIPSPLVFSVKKNLFRK